jgi:hypothetical protein
VIAKASEPPAIKEVGLTLQFKSVNPLIRQAAQQQNNALFDLMKEIFKRYLKSLIDHREEGQLILNDSSRFVI